MNTKKNNFLEVFSMDLGEDEKTSNKKTKTGIPGDEYGSYLEHAKEVLIVVQKMSIKAYGKTGVQSKRLRTVLEKLDDVIELYGDEVHCNFDPICPFDIHEM